MKITRHGLDELARSTKAKTRLAYELGKSVHTVELWIKKNKVNGPLTSAGALQVIKEELEVSDSEILEEDKVPA